MTNIVTDRKIMQVIGWLLAGFLLLTMLTSCYLPSPAATVTAISPAGGRITPTPLPYWQLAADTVRWQIIPAISGGRIGY